jgi:hypothetical protein
MTQPTPHDDGRPGRRHAFRGDRSPLASFLCPVCLHDALLEDVGCEHLLLIRDRTGEVYCRDRRIRSFYRDAEEQVGERGERAIERLCEMLGPMVVLYELLPDPRSAPGESSTLFVVDAGDAPGAASPG